MTLQLRRKLRNGLTLIELLVVLVVLAATAAVVVPKLGFVSDQAGHATAAAGAADLTGNIEQYKASTTQYPNYLESLLDATDSTTVASTVWNASSYQSQDITTLGDSATDYWYPLARAGITDVFDLNGTEPAATARTLDYNAACQCAVLKDAGTLAKKVYPPNGTIPANHIVVGFGIGKNCTLVGKTMASAPTHHMASPGDYNRFQVLFQLEKGVPTSCKLLAVVDSRGYTIEQRVGEYKKVTP